MFTIPSSETQLVLLDDIDDTRDICLFTHDPLICFLLVSTVHSDWRVKQKQNPTDFIVEQDYLPGAERVNLYGPSSSCDMKTRQK